MIVFALVCTHLIALIVGIDHRAPVRAFCVAAYVRDHDRMSDKTHNIGLDGILLLYVLLSVIGICGALLVYFLFAEWLHG